MQSTYPAAYPQANALTTGGITTATTTGYGQTIHIVGVAAPPRKLPFSPSLARILLVIYVAQLVCAFFCMVFEAVTLSQWEVYVLHGAGVVTGIFGIISGILGVLSAQQNKGYCLPVTNVVMSVLTCLAAFSQICYNGLAVAALSILMAHGLEIGGNLVLGMQATLIVFGIAMFSVATASGVIGGMGMCSPYTPPQSTPTLIQGQTSAVTTISQVAPVQQQQPTQVVFEQPPPATYPDAAPPGGQTLYSNPGELPNKVPQNGYGGEKAPAY